MKTTSQNLKQFQKNVDKAFLGAFGRTPLNQRLDDIFRETVELKKFTDIANLKEEAGDSLASLIQLCNECQWDVEELVGNTLAKIEKRERQYHSLGRKMQVAIIGGAFDPPTIGHIKLAQFVLNSSRTFDEVWFMPCAHHMYNKKMASASKRIAMCKIAASCDPRIRVSDYEIVNNLRGETYHLVKRLQNEDFARHQNDFSMIIGMDNANTFDKWVNFKELERMIRFVVVSRQGIIQDKNTTWYLEPPHILLHAESHIPESSSTQLRDWLKMVYWPLKNGDMEIGCHCNLDPNVLSYIDKYSLYE
ncbi:MAG: hypothetical protein WC375_08050 [Methanomassiliicoccales archaeon]|jgi:nicotinate-nucleotide adenylyltransferase